MPNSNLLEAEAALQQIDLHAAMKLKLFIFISASLATVGLLGIFLSAFYYSIEPQTDIQESQLLVRNIGNLKRDESKNIQNEGLVQLDKAAENIQSFPVAVVTPLTQSSQSSFAVQTSRYINTFGGVFLPCIFIGYILGDLLSIQRCAKRMTVQHRHVIGVFPNREAAGQVFDQLVFSGFLLTKVFLVGKDSAGNDPSVDAEITAALVNQAFADAITGTATRLRTGLAIAKVSGGLIGLLLGLGIFVLIGVDQIAVAPAVGFTLLSGGICAATGEIIGALIGLIMTKKQAREYGERVASGDYLVILNGTKDEIERAERILNTSIFPIIK